MRLLEADGEEEGLALLLQLLHQPDALGGDGAVGVGTVRHVGGLHRRPGIVRHQEFFYVGIFFQPLSNRFVEHLANRRALVGAEHRLSKGWIVRQLVGLGEGNRPRGFVELLVDAARIVDLSGSGGFETLATEILRQGDNVGVHVAHLRLQIPHPGVVRAQAGHQACPARPANRLLAVVVQKDRSRLRQPVDVRCPDERIAVATEDRLEVVHCNEENVPDGTFLFARTVQAKSQQRTQQYCL